MEYMNGKQIIQGVESYIKDYNYPHAVMIDGDWGVGKSYFVKNELVPAIEKIELFSNAGEKKHYKTMNISLYGISSIDDIMQLVRTNLSILKGRGGAAVKMVGGVARLAAGMIDTFTAGKILEVVSSAEAVNDLLDALTNLNEYVLIFDDLERCTISIHAVMGFISNIIERNDVRVVLVANEKEINHLYFEQNQELKYMFSALQGIDFTDIDSCLEQKRDKKIQDVFDAHSQRLANESSSDVSLPKVDVVHSRAKKIFNETNLYQLVREKVIGKKFHYRPDLYEVVPNIRRSLSITNRRLRGPVIEKTIIEVMVESKCLNLRCLYMALELYKKLYGKLSQISVVFRYDSSIGFRRERLKDIEKILLSSCVMMAIEHVQSNNSKIQEHSEFEEKKYVENVFIASSSIKTISFKFIKKYFDTGHFDWNEIQSVLGEIMLNLEFSISKNEDPLSKLETIWLLNDPEAEELLKALEENVYKDKYESNQYPKIIIALLWGEYCGLPVNLKGCVEFIKNEIRKNGFAKGMSSGFGIRQDPVIAEKYDSIIKEFEEIAANYTIEDSIGDINDYFEEEEGWATRLHNNLSEKYFNTSQYYKMSIMSIINIEKCIKCLQVSQNEDINQFRYVIIKNYEMNREINKDDCEKLKRLLDFARYEEEHCMHSIRRIQFNYLVGNIESVLQFLGFEIDESSGDDTIQ